MDQFFLEMAKSSPTAAIIGLVVWWTMRDQGRILRSIDLRLAKVLERTRETPAFGVPTREPPRHERHARNARDTEIPRAIARQRSRNDSDGDEIAIPRTMSEDLEEGDTDRKKRDRDR